MSFDFRFTFGFRVFLGLSLLALLVFIFGTIIGRQSSAQRKVSKNPISLFTGTESHEPGLENYDIRTEKKDYLKLTSFRGLRNVAAFGIADIKESMADAEEVFMQKHPHSVLEARPTGLGVEVIGASALSPDEKLTESSKGKRSDILKRFLKENDQLIGVSSTEVAQLETIADYESPEGRIGYVILKQFIDGIPVFQGEVKAGFTKKREIVRVINNLAPGIGSAVAESDFGSAEIAVSYAYGHINRKPDSAKLELNSSSSTNFKVVFGDDENATTAEKVFFPTEPGVVVPAWKVLIWQTTNAYYIVVDPKTGTLLWRKNIAADQTQPATYGVYRNPNAMIDVADSPFPYSPGPIAPNGAQGSGIPRSIISMIGNEGVYSFNLQGFLPDGVFKTEGNYVHAGIDRVQPDGIDPNGEAFSLTREFVSEYNPWNPVTNSGDLPLPSTQTFPPTDFQQGTVTQMFWATNWVLSELYRLGFTEQARNFQTNNFGRGGFGNDRVRAEGQDFGGTNNANFMTPTDGAAPKMQMYLWMGGGTSAEGGPRIDGNLDVDVVVHELVHGLSNRLIGNAEGLMSNMSGGMGEGWSDFYAHAMLSDSTDDVNGIYPIAGYAVFELGRFSVSNANYYYGIRRFPKARMSFRGPNGRPHNPLTFADIDSAQADVTDGAYMAAYNAPTVDQVHAAGEVWSSALWEVRCLMVERHGWEIGNRLALQIVTDGMKLSPNSPTFIQARDAIIAAATVYSVEALEDVWKGFAIRGMGRSARVVSPGTLGNTTRVVEAFDLPGLTPANIISIFDSNGGNGNGYAEPGELVEIVIPVTNENWLTSTETTLTVGNAAPVTLSNIPSRGTVNASFQYQVPSNLQCGAEVNLNLTLNSSVGNLSFSRKVTLGTPRQTFSENFDSSPALTLPAGWTVATESGSTVGFTVSDLAASSLPHSAFMSNTATIGGGSSLTSPGIQIEGAGAILNFNHRFNTEREWDGGVLEISIAGGEFIDIFSAGGEFLRNGYNDVLGPGRNNPLSNRDAWAGDSNGFISTSVKLPASTAGKRIILRWRFGADDNTTGTGANPGWHIDDIQLFGAFDCIAPCNLGLVPATTTNFGPAGGSLTVNVSASDAECPWTAIPTVDWISVTSGASGIGNGIVTVSVASNTGNARSASISIGGRFVAVTQMAAASMFGNARYYSSAEPISNVRLEAVGSNTISSNTDLDGRFALEGFGPGKYLLTPSKTGQVNGISSLDAAIVAQYSVGLISLNGNQLIAADVTGNGIVNSFDASRIAQWMVGISSWGENRTGTWVFSPSKREYESVTESLSEQDFIGILIGDVTGNWSLGAPSAGFHSDHGTVQQNPVEYLSLLRLFDWDDRFGQRFRSRKNTDGITGFSIDLSVEIPVMSYDAVILFDPDVIEPEPETPVETLGTLSSNFQIVVNLQERGRIRIAAFGVSPIFGTGELLRLRFKSKTEPFEMSKARIRYESLTINETEIIHSGKVIKAPIKKIGNKLVR